MAFTSSLESRALFKSRYLEEDRSSLDKSLNKNAGVIVQLCVDPRLRRERNYFAWFFMPHFAVQSDDHHRHVLEAMFLKTKRKTGTISGRV